MAVRLNIAWTHEIKHTLTAVDMPPEKYIFRGYTTSNVEMGVLDMLKTGSRLK